MSVNYERLRKIKAKYRNARELLEMMKNGDKYVRHEISGRSFLLWMMYYFPEMFVYALGDFHYEMVEDLNWENPFVVWAMFRGSAKTTFAKLYIVYCICHELEEFIVFDSHELEMAKSNLYDISVWLQTNKKILADYGQLYYESVEAGDEKKSKMKSVRQFITRNNIKVQAISTQKTPRGLNFKGIRPGLWVVDDFETEITVRSRLAIDNCIKHLDTARTGLSTHAKMIFLCNYFFTDGVVQYLKTLSQNDPDLWTFRKVDAETRDLLGKKVPTWSGKFVMTDKEAMIKNYNKEKMFHVVSLESVKRTLNAGGRRLYEMEMLQQAQESGNLYFDTEKSKIQEPFLMDPMYVAGNWKFWNKFDINKIYCMGADTSAGTGRDHSTAVLLQLAWAGKPAEVVGIFSSDKVDSKELGKQMVNVGRIFGQCLLCPEINNTGYATVYEIRDTYPISRLYHRVEKDKHQVKKTDKLGFYTTSQNKPTILLELKYAVETGELLIRSEDLYNEIIGFPMSEMASIQKKRGTTRHYDLVMALAIAWEMRHHATRSNYEKPLTEKIPEEKFDPFSVF